MPLTQGSAQRLKFQLIAGGKGSQASTRMPFQTADSEVQSDHGVLAQNNKTQRSSLHYKDLLNALPCAVLILNGQGVINEANTVARQWLDTDLIGQAWHRICSEKFTVANGSGDLLTSEGRFIDVSTCPLQLDAGQIILLTDVSEQRQMQKHLERQSRLSSMGEMMARLAHQIRTPLSSALLYQGQLVHEELSAPRQSDFSQKVLSRLRDLEQVVGDMLLFANGESRSFDVVPLESLFSEVVERLKSPFSKDNATLKYQLEKGLNIQGSLTSLVSALQNLCLNAIENAHSTCEVELTAIRSGESRVALSVHDNGKGIPQSMRETVFEPFFTTRHEGSGLGLYLARELCRVNYATLSYHNAPEGGAVFRIEFPHPDRLLPRVDRE